MSNTLPGCAAVSAVVSCVSHALQATAEATAEPTPCVPVPMLSELLTNGGFEGGMTELGDWSNIGDHVPYMFAPDNYTLDTVEPYAFSVRTDSIPEIGSARSGNYSFAIFPDISLNMPGDLLGTLSQTLDSCDSPSEGVAPTCTLSFYLMSSPLDTVHPSSCACIAEPRTAGCLSCLLDQVLLQRCHLCINIALPLLLVTHMTWPATALTWTF